MKLNPNTQQDDISSETLQPNFGLCVHVKSGPGGIPPVLCFLIERLGDFIDNPKRYLNLYDRKVPNIQKRTAIVQVLRSLVLRADLVSLKIGFPTIDGFRNSNVKRVVDDTGLDIRRINRVLYDLEQLNLVSRERKWVVNIDNKTYSGRPSKRFINPFLFTMFGLDKILKQQQKVKAQLDREKYKLMDETSRHVMSTLIKKLKITCKTKNDNHSSNATDQSKTSLNSNSNAHLNQDQRRAYTELAVKMYPELKAAGMETNEIIKDIEKMVLGITHRRSHALLATDRSVPVITKKYDDNDIYDEGDDEGDMQEILDSSLDCV